MQTVLPLIKSNITLNYEHFNLSKVADEPSCLVCKVEHTILLLDFFKERVELVSGIDGEFVHGFRRADFGKTETANKGSWQVCDVDHQGAVS